MVKEDYVLYLRFDLPVLRSPTLLSGWSMLVLPKDSLLLSLSSQDHGAGLFSDLPRDAHCSSKHLRDTWDFFVLGILWLGQGVVWLPTRFSWCPALRVFSQSWSFAPSAGRMGELHGRWGLVLYLPSSPGAQKALVIFLLNE